MRKIFSIGMLALFPLCLVSQTRISNAHDMSKIILRCDYQLSYSKNRNDLQDKTYALMTLEIGSKDSKFYSREAQQKDSLLYWDLQALSATEILANKSRYSCKAPKYLILKNDRTKGAIRFCSKILDQYYQYSEQLDLNWKYSNETDTLLGYVCTKAECRYGGRDYEAWFTTEIPIADGPYKFCGTPGLILAISDTESQYSFRCIEIRKGNGQSKIRIPERDYIRCRKKEFLQAEKRSKQDLIKYINNSTGITISRKSPGVAKAKFLYNPIELE